MSYIVTKKVIPNEDWWKIKSNGDEAQKLVISFQLAEVTADECTALL